MSNEHTNTCVVCGRPAVVGSKVCPGCEAYTDRWNRPQSEFRLIWNNPSHDGPPSAVRFLTGPYSGQTVKIKPV